MHSLLKQMVDLQGHTLFKAVCSSGKSTCSYDKTFVETPDAYLRLAEKYQACGQWFVAFQSHKQQPHNNSNVCALAEVYIVLHKLSLKTHYMLYFVEEY